MTLHFAIDVLLTFAAGLIMIKSGMQTRLLERPRETCPSCGRVLKRRVCAACTQ
jgi:hypothetical protein